MAAFLANDGQLSLLEIELEVAERLGPVPSSSVRSYLNAHTPGLFDRTKRGFYRLTGTECVDPIEPQYDVFEHGRAKLVHADCFDWLKRREAHSIHAVVTDPPYGLVEFDEDQLAKRDRGQGGVWRVPPSFDGAKRAPLPRFTVLGDPELERLNSFFLAFGKLLLPALVPGANVIVASNPLLSHIVTKALCQAGLERRGAIVRTVMTMRGGDRPKNAHKEFDTVSVMPRSMWEPWIVFRKPLDGRVQDNLRRWKTGGFRRISADQPFGDLIASRPTPKREKGIAPHPSLKPQDFMRRVVRGALPLCEGVLLDPFAGGGATLAAAEWCAYESIGIEKSAEFFEMAKTAIPHLAKL